MTVGTAAIPRLASGEKRQRFVRWSALAIALIALLKLLSLALSPWIRLGINGTASLPGVLYLVVKNEMPDTRGDLIAFYPPPNRYYPSGMFFIKKVMGLPGDQVSRIGRTYYINGSRVAIAKPYSRSGNTLQLGPTGRIPKGKYFVWTPHPDSYDSRYEDIGWISQDRVIGRAVHLF